MSDIFDSSPCCCGARAWDEMKAKLHRVQEELARLRGKTELNAHMDRFTADESSDLYTNVCTHPLPFRVWPSNTEWRCTACRFVETGQALGGDFSP